MQPRPNLTYKTRGTKIVSHT